MNRQKFFALLMVGFVPAVALAYTDHSGALQSSEVWTAAGSPHVLRSTTVVPAGINLVVEQGAVIAATEDAQLQVYGTIEVQGTAEHRVLITGLDQNQWGGLVFGEMSSGYLNNATIATSSSMLMHVISSQSVRMYGDSLQYSPVSENAVGLAIDGGHVDITGGVVISPLAELYSILLTPVHAVDPIQVSQQNPIDHSIDIQRGATALIKDFQLEQNYPNPFNPRTTIRYSVPWNTHVVLSVYDVSGKEVQRLVDADQPGGEYSVDFLADEIPSGLYFYRMQAGDFINQKRMLLIK